eukprot:TRINITY_DN3855_c0_g1_i1.p1 TRINITY_DN3855_c0_g1~~TRINITY_DN3855_c0_g1_i1.p1  ORF type:complete len:259 (-),score=32.69 TRINITY_DN3855_c0_g1_i1:132-908(-)
MDYCAVCQVLPSDGVNRKTRLCATHFNEQVRLQGDSPCFCAEAQAMDAAAKAARQGMTAPLCTGNGSSCYATSKKRHMACTRCRVRMPCGLHSETYLCPCCFYSFRATETRQWVCNCMPTRALMEECRRLQESMLAAKAEGSDQKLLLPQPPPPPTEPWSGQARSRSNSGGCGARGLAPPSTSWPEAPGRGSGGASTASATVQDQLQQVLAELRDLKALVLHVGAKVDVIEAKVDTLSRPSQSDPSDEQQNSTACYDV